MSKLLIEESPLTFQPSLAVAIGLNEAIVLQQIHYWIKNTKNKGYEQDGYKWVYNTYAEWKESNFPFWSENTIQRTFASLEEKGLVVSIQPMKGKYDRTKYYRIEYTKLEVFDDPKMVCSLNESEITTETTAKDIVSLSKRQLANTSIEAAIFGGMPITEEMMNEARLKDEAPKMFEAALGFSRPLAWTSDKDWTSFGAWVLDVYRTDPKAFERFETWRNTPYVKGSISNNRIRGFVNEFYDAWDMFKKQDAGSTSTLEDSGWK